MNQVTLIGRLARDPELNYTPQTQTAITRFTLAVDRPKRNGEDSGADFIRITVFGKQAENCDRYLDKGRQVAVSGRIQTGSYKNRNGETVYTTEVIAERIEFLGGSRREAAAPAPVSAATQTSFDDLPDTFQAAEDDIPF
ncbi:MAG: single-stranded DNA-binding protein [Clostridiales bacterium]|nr:single-stranded DNA-binding protein [Candidatus Crickella merdequi]